ncbi:hypothetical protein PAHAL_1G411400 [Panicum hallii]|uniref:Uncharacterized protein n=1 Tax=Panicum hallii TaxID=206008 RepID=A0A2T8KXV2_9POAL|nr:hypothetical protein PAHAL_1G411400 [Panicum hallii]
MVSMSVKSTGVRILLSPTNSSPSPSVLLPIQEGLLAMSNAVTRIRESVKYVKSSQGRKQRFEKMIKEVGIACDKRPPLDVATRWNSTYQMLKVCSGV